MKNKMMLGTVEKVALGEIEFCEDILEVWVGIKEVSDNLKGKIEQTVKEAKAESKDRMMRYCGRDWKEDTPITLSLHVVANQKDKSISTRINVFFEEPVVEGDETSGEFDSGEFEIDLSGCENELKKIILNGMINKFF